MLSRNILKNRKTRQIVSTVFVVAFGVIGTILLSGSHAATPAASIEAENGILGSCSTHVTDSTASNGQAIKFAGCGSTTDPTTLDASGGTIPDTNYAIPTGAIFMATSGNDSNAGTQTAPVATLNRAIALVPSGGTIVVRGGTYRDWYSNAGGTSYASITKSLTLQAYPHEQVWFDGTNVEPTNQWTSDGAGHWYMAWSTPSFCAGNYYEYAYNNQSGSTQNPGSGNTGPCAYYDTYGDPSNPAVADPQMVYKDGTAVHEVASLSGVDANDFYYQEDLANKTGRMYIGFNPSGHTVELAARPTALQVGSSNTTIRGVGFKRYATNSYSNATHGAVSASATHIIIENDVFKQMAGEALAGGGGATYGTVSHSVFTNNGYDGIGWNGHQHTDGSTDDLVIENSAFNGNNAENFDIGCSASCGASNIKLAHMDGFTLKNNILENAVGRANGFWCDLACSNGVLVDNLVHNNGGDGLMYEVSNTGTIASNLVYNNGGYGLRIVSANTKVYNNTLVNNTGFGGVWVYDDTRSEGYAGWTDVGPDTTNVSFVNNIIVDTLGSVSMMNAQGKASGQTNTQPNQFFSTYDYNAYDRTNATQRLVRWVPYGSAEVDYKSTSAFTAATGFDAHSTDVSAVSDPFFTNMAGNNYVVRSNSTAYHSGTTIPADVAAAIGASTTGLSRGAVIWPGQ